MRKPSIFNVSVVLSLCTLILFLAACNGPNGGGPQPSPAVSKTPFVHVAQNYYTDGSCPLSWNEHKPVASTQFAGSTASQALSQHHVWSLWLSPKTAVCLRFVINGTPKEVFLYPKTQVSAEGLVAVAPPSTVFNIVKVSWAVYGTPSTLTALDSCQMASELQPSTYVALIKLSNIGPSWQFQEGELSVLTQYCQNKITPTLPQVGFNPTVGYCPASWNGYPKEAAEQLEANDLSRVNGGWWLSVQPGAQDARGTIVGPGAVCLVATNATGMVITQMFEPASTVVALLLVKPADTVLLSLHWFVYGGESFFQAGGICSGGYTAWTPITTAGPNRYGGEGYTFGTLGNFCAHNKGA